MVSREFTAVIIGLIVVLIFSEAEGADWRKLFSNQQGNFLYNAESIYRERAYLSVWTKFIFNKQGRNWVAKHYKKKLEDIQQVFILFEVDCTAGKICVEKSTFGSHDGLLILSLDVPSDFAFIKMDSVKESLYKVCNLLHHYQ